MRISINTNDIDNKKLKRKDRKCFLKLAKNTFSILKLNEKVELSLNIVSKEKIKELNSSYSSKDKETDVLSFPYFDSLDEEEKKNYYISTKIKDLGDIFICKEVALSQAKQYGHSFKREICFLFVHGLLHLLGYDHLTKEEEKEMFSLQEKILANTNY